MLQDKEKQILYLNLKKIINKQKQHQIQKKKKKINLGKKIKYNN